jgi:hypothetical protein
MVIPVPKPLDKNKIAASERVLNQTFSLGIHRPYRLYIYDKWG